MKLYETLEQQLKKEPNFVTDNGELKKWVVLNKAQNFDEELIGLLLDNAELKDKFFVKVKEMLVFNQNLFMRFLEQKNYLNDSYTQYKNKIGLTIDGKYLKQRNEVALVWPFKDCVLEGGQSREEDKREEIFFNEILAQDEITQLLEPKVLTNAKRIDKDGEKPLDQFNRNENGTITDNLIIKGNNLLALHTLKEEFAGKVKLIYIDPPYYFKEKQSDDAFAYNSNFKLSTWLSFMKNRLEIAYQLLTSDGLLYVQTNEDGQAYLKTLMDDLFTEKKFVSQITWQRTSEGRSALGQGTSFIINSTEYILCYSKNNKPTTNLIKKRVEATDKALSQYTFLLKTEGTRVLEKEIKDSRGNAIKIYRHSDYEYKRIPSQVSNEERLNDFEYLVREAAQQKESSLQQKILSELEPETLYSVEYTPTSGKSKGAPIKSFYINGGILLFLKDYAEVEDGKVFRLATMNDFWTHDEIPVTGIANEGNVNLKRGKKPEKLIQRIIEMSAIPGDIILDYHLGSGTTAAVAHKLNRKFIGIEQLDYGGEDCVQRLKNVINGDSSGISSEVNWQGGGSFVYLELKKYNQTFIEQIEEAKNTEALLRIWEHMKEKSFFKYSIDLQKFENSIPEFKQFTLEMQKEVLMELLDKNQMYVNLSSLNDADFACTDDEKRVTKDFYQIKK
ncbi:MAG TPA: site-specific DNA-methyltransferase [Bacteroidetes bacterium]|nr:site-specific DNA-methyltransferase [Bacteroidota bacterium]